METTVPARFHTFCFASTTQEGGTREPPSGGEDLTFCVLYLGRRYIERETVAVLFASQEREAWIWDLGFERRRVDGWMKRGRERERDACMHSIPFRLIEASLIVVAHVLRRQGWLVGWLFREDKNGTITRYSMLGRLGRQQARCYIFWSCVFGVLVMCMCARPFSSFFISDFHSPSTYLANTFRSALLHSFLIPTP